MNWRLFLLAIVACFTSSVTAHASDIAFNITGGTFEQTGTFSGSFLINSATEMLDGGTITAVAPTGGPTYNLAFSQAQNDSPIKGLEIMTDNQGDTFILALNGAISALAINAVPIWGTSDTALVLASGARFDALGGTITQSVAPEPASFLLFGTGALGLAAFARRRHSHQLLNV